MLWIRVVKTASGAKAVQVIHYHNRKRKIFKHIRSANSESELADLKSIALDLINNHSPLPPFDGETKSDNLLLLDKSEFIGVYYSLFYEVIAGVIAKLGDKLIEQIDKTFPRKDGESIRIKTDNGYLICSFSSTRFRKEQYEMEKQIE